MDRQSTQRDLVFCHECEEEWYRNEHGLTCPHCHSDFCEVIEQNHDPRDFHNQDEEEIDYDPHYRHHHDADDPDEDDIDQFGFHPGITSTFEVNGRPMGGTTISTDQGTSRQDGPTTNDPRNAIIASFSTMLQGMMGGMGGGPGNTQRTTWHTTGEGGGQVRTSTYEFGNGRFSFTSTSGTAGGPVDGPTPGMNRGGPGGPHDMGQWMADMFGSFAQHPGGGGPARAGGFPGPFSGFLNTFLTGQHGDGVYTEEAFDRILSQLMDHNTTGNAPGPAQPDEIAALPKKKVDKEMLGDNGKAECTICMDEVAIGDEVTELYCGHWFHGDCIKAWLSSHDTCPHCRKGIKESKAQSKAGGASNGDANPGESSSNKRDRPSGGHSRRSSNMSFRRRSSTTGMNEGSSSTQSRPSPSHRDSQHSRVNSQTDSNSPGLLDRARNLFSRGS